MIELVVCDLAGTTVHDGDAVSDSFRAALAAADLQADPAAVNQVMGLPKPEAIRQLLTGLGRPADATLVESLHADFVRRMSDYYATAPAIREIPGASAAFSAFRRAGWKVGLNTGFSRDIVEVLLARLGWSVPETVDGVVASDEVQRGRPWPDMIQMLMRQCGVSDPRRVVKIGDTWADLEEGQNTGCGIVIGVTSGSFTRADLEQRPHTCILGSIAEAPGYLQAGREASAAR